MEGLSTMKPTPQILRRNAAIPTGFGMAPGAALSETFRISSPSTALICILILLGALTAGCGTAATMAPPSRPEPLINLKKIILEPMVKASDGQARVVIRKTREGQDYMLLNLSFQGAGIHIVEAIKQGRILEHRIVVRNSRGEILGTNPINFQAVKVTRTRIQQDEQEVLVTEENTTVPFEEAGGEKETVKRSYSLRSFDENDRIPQSIILTKVPTSGEYVTVYVELTLVDPVLQELCTTLESGACPRATNTPFREIRQDNEDTLSEIIQRYKNYEKGPFRFTLKKTPDYYRKSIQEEIDKLNERDTHDRYTEFQTPGGNRFEGYSNVARTGSKVFYREWRLLGEPRYFQVALEKDVVESIEEKKKIEQLKKEQNLEGRDKMLEPEGSYDKIYRPEGSY